MELKKYYKIVYKFDNIYYSAVVSGLDCIKYESSKWVDARLSNKMYGYHLTVFDSLENVKKWLIKKLKIDKIDFEKQKLYIFKCKIKNKLKKLPPLSHLGPSSQILWKFDDGKLKWPEGTIMAEQVKIYGKPINIFDD